MKNNETKSRDFYIEGKKKPITQERFERLFCVTQRDRFRLTCFKSEDVHIEWETGYLSRRLKGTVSFYERGKLKGKTCMLLKFRTKDYNELVDYLFSIGEQWRFEK